MRIRPPFALAMLCASVAAAALPGVAAGASVDVVKRGEVVDFDVDSSGRTYTAWSLGKRAYVTVRTRNGRLLAQKSGRGSFIAGSPRVAVIGNGIAMVWFGGTREVATYTSGGRKIAAYKFNDDVVGVSADPAVDGLEGRGGAVAFRSGEDDDGVSSVVRFAPSGKLIGAVAPFMPKLFADSIRFGFDIGGALTAFATGENPDGYDINAPVVVARRIDGDNQLGALLTLNVPGTGRTLFADPTAVALGREKDGSAVLGWPNVYQPDTGNNSCTYQARRVSAAGDLGPLVQAVPTLTSKRGVSNWTNKCPYGAGIAAAAGGSTALVGYGDNLRVVRMSPGGSANELRRISVGNWQRGRVSRTSSAQGWAVASWARYSNSSKRTTMKFVVTSSKGSIRQYQLRTPNAPASLLDVDVSPSGRLRALVRRGDNYLSGARVISFR